MKTDTKQVSKIRWWTGAILFFGTLLVTAWDAWAFSAGGGDATISAVISDGLGNTGFVAMFSFGIGWLLCHLFGWSRRNSAPMMLAIAACCSCVAFASEASWPDQQLYNYRATVVRIVDGDTIDVDVDLGFSIHTKQRLRLLGINAPEVKGPTKAAGDAATDHLRGLLSEAAEADGSIRIHTERADSFGRYLTVVKSGQTSVNQLMLDDGFAVPFLK